MQLPLQRKHVPINECNLFKTTLMNFLIKQITSPKMGRKKGTLGYITDKYNKWNRFLHKGDKNWINLLPNQNSSFYNVYSSMIEKVELRVMVFPDKDYGSQFSDFLCRSVSGSISSINIWIYSIFILWTFIFRSMIMVAKSSF